MKHISISLIVLFFMNIQVGVLAQFNPHSNKTNYDESFRGQYHFSPKSEWMNDINGLVYQGGKYHMIYQWGESVRHGGVCHFYRFAALDG